MARRLVGFGLLAILYVAVAVAGRGYFLRHQASPELPEPPVVVGLR